MYSFCIVYKINENNLSLQVLGIRDVTKLEEQFAKTVSCAPETIECRSQNIPISKFLTFEQTWNTPKDENFAQKRIKLKNGYES